MATVGALVVGIGAYRAGVDAGLTRLRFAAEDAAAVAQYLKGCWPGARDLTLVWIDEDSATAATVEAGLRSLAEQGPYELCWVFISGHGWVDGAIAGVLVQPDGRSGDLPLLDAATLDRLLAGIAAQRTVLVLDCCFAEALVCRMAYFTALGGSVARLYVASSRAEQRTWEDDGIRHGVFTAHLLDLLNTGSAAQFERRKDRLDVDAELFPVLCEQVPLYVLEHKNGAHQEPVKGGISCAAVTLPVASAARRLRDRTVLGAAVQRLRQMAASIALAGLALMLLTYVLGYYIEPGANGTLIVRHGTRWLEPVLRVLPLERVDTGIAVGELSVNVAASAPLQSGYVGGIWTHSAAGGYRAWFTAVLAGLEPAAAARYAALAGDAPPALGSSPYPSEVERAAWMALSDGRRGSLAAILRHVPGGDRRSREAIPFSANKMDFEILDLTEAHMESYANALAYAAALDPVQVFPAYLGFAKATQEWLTHNTDAQRGRGARARVRATVAGVLDQIATARSDRGLPPLGSLDREHLLKLAAVGYADIVGLGLSLVKSDRGPRLTAATEALKRFRGDPGDPAQGAAFETIVAGLDDSAPARAIVDSTLAAFARSGSIPNTYHTRFLIAAADAQAMSAGLVGGLIAKARVTLKKAETDFEDSEHARVLAHAMSQIPPDDRPVALALINRVASAVTPMSSTTAEMYGALGRQRLDPPGMMAKVQEQAFRAKPYTSANPGIAMGPMPGMAILVGPGPWLVALSEYGRTRELPARDVELLREHMANPALREPILGALMRREKELPRDAAAESWMRRLGALPRDARARAIEEAVIAGDLARRARPQFDWLIGRLRDARARAKEPELRVALGSIIIESQLRRTKQPPGTPRGDGSGEEALRRPP